MTDLAYSTVSWMAAVDDLEADIAAHKARLSNAADRLDSFLRGVRMDAGSGRMPVPGTALPGEAQAPAGLGPDGRVSTFAGEVR
jgi:hypothetical protein